MGKYDLAQSGKATESGDFDEMMERASDLASEVGGLVVVHRKYCLEQEIKDDCSCNPLIVTPYSLIEEKDLEGFDN